LVARSTALEVLQVCPAECIFMSNLGFLCEKYF
jgi:hypothetical protein